MHLAKDRYRLRNEKLQEETGKSYSTELRQGPDR